MRWLPSTTTIRGRGFGVWLWRWRSSPLRRRVDTLEAWVVLAVWTVTVIAGVLAGVAAAHSVERDLARERATWHPLAALLAEDAPKETAATAAGGGRVWATARWTSADGSTRTGQVRVAARSPEGTAVTVWTDRGGSLVTTPDTASEARTRANLFGALMGAGAAAVPLMAGRVVRDRLERRRMEQWDEAWARFGPTWGRTTG
ncbi:hypothetical protein AB0C59_02900 [Streptomyces sp. NPDC048664]|uniref:Rv1733c family protein n=1 Tax=Streptomyces sp. NPDC048664 TaxID=3154505 RepID=UPI003419C17F